MKNVLILTYWSYKDALMQSYTLPYVKIIKKQSIINKIFLVTIEQPFHKMNNEAWRIECERLRKENIELIRFRYDNFGFKMFFRIIGFIPQLVRLIRKENIASIHSWCMPAGALGYILSILTTKPLIIDSYEPHAEAMVENGTWKKTSFKFKLLFWLEKKQSNRAGIVIALTEGMKKYAQEKYNVTLNNFYVKPALVNLNKFDVTEESYVFNRKKYGVEDKVVCIYAGKLGGIYLEEEIFDFIKVAYQHWGDRLKVFLLTNEDIKKITTYLESKNIPSNCVDAKFVSYDEIHTYYGLSDFAINPVKPVPSKRYCTSIKDGEYWAAGLPVIITKDISDDSEIIEKENIGYVLKELSSIEYNNACIKIKGLIEDKRLIHKKIRAIAIKYRSFEIANEIYEEIYQ